jgi:hypothetical protein
MSRLNSRNVSYLAVRNVLLTKSIKIKIYKTVILRVVLYGFETWSLALREQQPMGSI